jgi:hypothetical protein
MGGEPIAEIKPLLLDAFVQAARRMSMHLSACFQILAKGACFR